jgi:hypothetical protein
MKRRTNTSVSELGTEENVWTLGKLQNELSNLFSLTRGIDKENEIDGVYERFGRKQTTRKTSHIWKDDLGCLALNVSKITHYLCKMWADI